MSSLRVIISCGGSGGHLFPGIAVAQALRARGHETLLLISEKAIDATAAKDHPELAFATVPAIGMPRLASPKVIPFAFKFWKTLRVTKKIVRDFRADAVLGMGGFTCLAPALAGRKQGAKTFVHESNAIPGKANRLIARFCDVVLVGLADCAPFFPGKDTRVVGTPLRASMLAPVDKAAAYAFFGLDPAKKTLLIMGGSQGARGVNRALLESLPTFDPATIQVLWLTGREDEAEVRAAIAASGHQAFMEPFHPRLDLAYAIADLCLARSGASSLAELAHFGVATILIPLPTAAEDHQTRNAEVFARQEAAIHLKQADATTAILGPMVRDLLADDPRRLALAARLHALRADDAAEQVARIIEEAVK